MAFIDVRLRLHLRLATKASSSHTFLTEKFSFVNMENLNPVCKQLFNGELLDLIDKVMAYHTVFDGTVNHVALFTSRPTRFFLVPGSTEHAYYSLLLFMLEHCEKYEFIMLQLANDQYTIGLNFKTKFNAGDGKQYSTVMNHTKILRTLQSFAQEKISSLTVEIVGYN